MKASPPPSKAGAKIKNKAQGRSGWQQGAGVAHESEPRIAEVPQGGRSAAEGDAAAAQDDKDHDHGQPHRPLAPGLGFLGTGWARGFSHNIGLLPGNLGRRLAVFLDRRQPSCQPAVLGVLDDPQRQQGEEETSHAQSKDRERNPNPTHNYAGQGHPVAG
jgi:hypothetical protein